MKSMKMNKVKHKGKVHPSPSSSSSSSSSTPSASSLPAIKDTETALKLLPATILALITILSVEEREVLAYMITRSIKATASNPDIQEKSAKKRSSSSKKQAVTGMGMVVMGEHKPPVFDCGCFDCYTSYWFRWDSSPNRELIHQAIEGFEEHLARGEKENIAGSGKRRERIGRRGNGKKAGTGEAGGRGKSVSTVVPVAEVVDAAEIKVEEDEAEAGRIEQLLPPPPQTLAESAEEETEMLGTVVGTAEGPNHKGLARKVLPDVIGLLNSRFWNLWTPNA